MTIKNIAVAIVRKLGITTKAEKQIQKEFQKEIQMNAKKLQGEMHDIFTKQLDGSISHVQVSDAELEQINKHAAKVLQKAGIPDINTNPNYNRHNLYEFDDAWNPNYRR